MGVTGEVVAVQNNLVILFAAFDDQKKVGVWLEWAGTNDFFAPGIDPRVHHDGSLASFEARIEVEGDYRVRVDLDALLEVDVEPVRERLDSSVNLDLFTHG